MNMPAKQDTQRALSPYQDLAQRLEARRTQFRQMLGNDASAGRFIRIVLMAAQQNPALLKVESRSLLIACMKAAADGLMPDGREAVLNVYATRAQYLPMVGGVLKKLWESGLYTMLDGCAVYERDHFRYQRGDMPSIDHVPYDGDDDPGPVRAAYFIARLKNGEVKREVMWRRDIEKVRHTSQAAEGLMWRNWYDQGAIKSVIKRAYKQLPSTPALDQLMTHDNEALELDESMDASPSAAGQRGGATAAEPGSGPLIHEGTANVAAGGRLGKKLERKAEQRLAKLRTTEESEQAGSAAPTDAPPTPAGPELWAPTDEEIEAIRQRELDEARGT